MARNYTRYTKEQLEAAAKESISISEVLRRLGKPWSGGLHGHIKNKMAEFGIDTSHFLGQRANIKKGCRPRRPWTDILKTRTQGRRERALMLRRAMLQSGTPLLCAGGCGLAREWNGKPLTLEINHRNGNNIDDSKGNLEFICPNCHSQIPNHKFSAQ